MGSIPLPALDVHTQQQQPDLLSKYAQLTQLRAAQQQQQLAQQEAPLRLQQLQQGVQQGQQQAQMGDIQLQQQQQSQKDQQAVTAAMQHWDGKDLSALPPLVLKNGGSAQAVIGLQQKTQEMQKNAAETFKNQQDGGKAAVETLKQKGDLISGALSPLVDPSQVPDAQLPQQLATTVQDLTQKGLLDPQHAQAAAQLAQSGNPQAIRQGIDLFRKTFMAQTQIAEQAHNDALEAQAQATQKEAARYHQVEAAQRQQQIGIEGGRLSVERQRVAIQTGDPNAAAQLLVNGDATLSELKARGSTPEFISKTLQAAHDLSGGKYNSQAADAQFSVAKSPANVAFFGSAKSLTDKGGTLDQLAAAAKDIPGGKIPAFNSIADWEKAATGSGPIAKYAAIALGVSDDYAKVMGGGQGSDSSRMQALKLVGASQSPDQRAGSIGGIRGAVASQTNSRIGSNPVLKRMYAAEQAESPAQAPQASAPPAGATHTVPGSDGKMHYTDGKRDLGVVPQ